MPYRNPIATAKAMATLDRRSGGRLITGIGVGWIGIGGYLAMPPLPHHRAYGSVPRRFDWGKLGQRQVSTAVMKPWASWLDFAAPMKSATSRSQVWGDAIKRAG
jgi:hypothetical protein